MREIHSRKLLPTEAAACPFCGDHDLYINQEPSKDGTITWHTIHHGAPTPCSIRMLDIREDKLLERWNRRTRFDKPTSENIVEVALLFCEENNTVNTAEVVNTTSALLFIIERLYENGNISIPTRREREEERDNEAG